MTTHNPDKWVILKFWNDKTVESEITYKIFCGWYSGFSGVDSWKLNSGITGVERKEKFIKFTGYTSSVYQVHEDSYGISSYMHIIYQRISEALESDTRGNKMVLLTKDEAMEFCNGKK